jgi:hypothetical protein
MFLKRVAIITLAAAVLLPSAFGRGRDIQSSLGVSLFPGATPRPERTSPAHDKAAISLEDVVASNVSAAVFVSQQPRERVLSFYRDELKRLGSVVECHGGANVRVHVRVDADSVSDPSACHIFDFGLGDTELKAVKNGDQVIVSVATTPSGSEFAIVRVQSARKCPPGQCSPMM